MEYTKTVWKDLPDTSTPITADRLNNLENGVEYLFENESSHGINEYSQSTTDSYSCNYVNNINTYSTDEVRIGTWLGKPLYRKVLETTTPATANTWTDTGMFITGVFLGVGLGYVNVSADEQYPMNGQSDIYFYHNKGNGKLLIQCTDYYKSKEIKVAIEYTKATD